MDTAALVIADPPMSCPECGLVTPLSSTHGLCPRCLLGLAVEPEEAPRAAVGSRLGGLPDFTLVREIGSGGAGVVYEAIQESTRQTVALKLLRRASPAAEERFRVEAKTAATLAHPNILPVFEVGEADDGLFYVMKFALRGSLAANLNSLRAKSPDAAWCRSTAGLLAQLAHALQHAHARGIIHRDLKPSNILLDADGTPYLADFGLARSLKEDARLTLTDAIIGTPHYMAPEQAAGNRAAQTTATDLYSFGAVIYALLTGQPPFPGDNVWEVIRHVREGTPVPPRRAISGQRSAVNGQPAAPSPFAIPHSQFPPAFNDLETLCLKCLEKDPARRPASSTELAAELERIANGQRILARPATRAERFVRWCEREPVVAALSGALTLALLIALGLAVAHGRKMSALARFEAEQLARAEADNRALRRTVSHTLLAEAEKNLGQQQFAEGAAVVAAVLRHDPQHPVAGSWAKHFARLAVVANPSEAVTPLGPPQLLGAAGPDQCLVQEGPRHLRVWSATLGGPDPRAAWTAAADLVAVQADAAGHRVIATCADGTVWSWEPMGAAGPQPLTQLPSAPTLLRLSPDGKQVLLAGSNGFVRCWQVEPPKKIWSTQWHAGAVLDANWDTEGKLLVSSGTDGRVMVWDATTGQPAGPDLNFTNVASVAFAPQRPWFAVGAQDQHGLRVRWLKPAENWPLLLAPVPMDAPIERVAFLASNVCFTVTSNRVRLSAFNDTPASSRWTNHKVIPRPPGTTPRASPDGAQLAMPNADGSLTLLDTRTQQPFQPPLRTDSPITEALVTRDGRSVLLRRVDDKLNFVPLDNLSQSDFVLPVGDPEQFDFVLGGRGLLTREGPRLALWPLPKSAAASPRPAPKPLALGSSVLAHAVSPSGELLALAQSNAVRLRRLRETPASPRELTTEPIGEPVPLNAIPQQLHFTPDNAKLLVVHTNAPCVVIETATGRVLTTWPAPASGTLWAVADTESALVAKPDGQLRRLALADGRVLAEARFPFTSATFASLTLDATREFLAVADVAGRVQIFAARTLAPAAPPIEHGATLATQRFTPDGKQLYTAGYDSTVRFWDWRAGKAVGQPFASANPHPSLRAVDAALWPGRPWLILSTRNKRFRIWDITDRTRPVPDFYSNRDLPPTLITPDGAWFVFVVKGGVQLLAAARFERAVPPWFADFLEDLHGCQRLPDGTPARRPPLKPEQLHARYPLAEHAQAPWLTPSLRR